MDSHLLIVGLIFIICPILLAPFQIRIAYLFLCHPDFKTLECYKIMAMICLSNVTYGLCFVPMGVTILTQCELLGFTIGAFKLWMAAWAAVLALDLALAVNRLRLICNFHFLCTISKYLHFAALIYPALLLVLMLSRMGDIVFLEDKVFFKYDLQKPLSGFVKSVHGSHNIVCVTCTLTIYLMISFYLIAKKCRHNVIGIARGERIVVVQAVVKFLANSFVIITMNFFGAFFQQSFWAMATIPLFQVFNLLALPILICIGFNRKTSKFGLQMLRQRVAEKVVSLVEL
uniref:Serpentine Receptor, class T n=1 Tax=Steinernema glaseri TaxID=37863 RepID=A0A1I7Z4Z6_9BILA